MFNIRDAGVPLEWAHAYLVARGHTESAAWRRLAFAHRQRPKRSATGTPTMPQPNRPDGEKRRPKGTRIRNVRVPDDIWLPAKTRAEREGTTLTAVIVQRLGEYGAERSERPVEQDPDRG